MATTPCVPLGRSLIRASPAAAPDLTPEDDVQDANMTVRRTARVNVIAFFMDRTSSMRSSHNTGYLPDMFLRRTIP
jgi:hypothetical protein